MKKTVKQLREKMQLSQEELAVRVGVSYPTINAWERGYSEPRKPTKSVLAKVLNVMPEDIIFIRKND